MRFFPSLGEFLKGRMLPVFVLSVFVYGLISPGLVWANNASISLEVASVAPQITLSSVSQTGLEVEWNWDSVSPGYIPPAVTQVDVEISSDLINYTNLQQLLPSEFSVVYLSLSAGTYTARVTVYDGADIQYIVGPVVLTGSTGGGGRTSIGGNSSGGTIDLPGLEPQPPNITLSGLAYPGPTSVVIFTYDGAFQTTVDPDNFGDFVYQTTSLPAGGATFAFSAQDPAGTLSAPVSFFYSVAEGQTVNVDTIYLPPTLKADLSVVPVGEDLQISGYGYREGALSLRIQGVSSSAVLTQAAANGYWSVSMPTSGLDAGTYSLVAVSTSLDGSITSPESSPLTFELVDALPVAPACGDGVVESPEACDDGNLTDGDGCSSLCEIEGCGDGQVILPETCDDGNVQSGDGCSSTCQIELQLPQTRIAQPTAPAVFSTESVDLSYQVLSEPNGAISTVQVYFSRDGGAYELYPNAFAGGVIQLIGLADGEYQVYSLGRDSAGYLEAVPLAPDATFTVDVVRDFDVLAYPEKRVPPEGNWGMASRLDIYEIGESAPKYSFDIVTDDQGAVSIDLDETFESGVYDVVLKGISHLSKRLEDVDMTNFNDLVLDFTENGTFYLFAGDVQSSKDDYINSLDVSAILGMLYLNNIDGDLNLDSSVNALDLSVVMRNLQKRGDGSR